MTVFIMRFSPAQYRLISSGATTLSSLTLAGFFCGFAAARLAARGALVFFAEAFFLATFFIVAADNIVPTERRKYGGVHSSCQA